MLTFNIDVYAAFYFPNLICLTDYLIKQLSQNSKYIDLMANEVKVSKSKRCKLITYASMLLISFTKFYQHYLRTSFKW